MTDSNQLRNYAVKEFKSGHYESALISFNELVKKKTALTEDWFNLGLLNLQLKNHNEAIQCFKKAKRDNRYKINSQKNIALCHQLTGNHETAIKKLTEIRKLEADDYDVVRLMATSKFLLDNAVGAVETISKIPSSKFQQTDLEKLVAWLAHIDTPVANPNQNDFIRMHNALVPETPPNFSELEFYFIEKINFVSEALDPKVQTYMTQSFSGPNIDLGCEHHMRYYQATKQISSNCFNCLKLELKANTPLDLLHIWKIFKEGAAPNFLKKTMIELRSGSSGNFKGFLYCRDEFDLDVNNKVLLESLSRTSATAEITMKRGCSEFKATHQEFEKLPSSPNAFTQPEEWRIAEEKYKLESTPRVSGLRYSTKLTLLDLLIWRNWLYYFKKTCTANPAWKNIDSLYTSRVIDQTLGAFGKSG